VPKDPHHAALERMYLSAPINAVHRPRIDISDSAATIEIDLTDALHHAAGAVHGSVYFKMLDDAAFFATNSVEREEFVLTSSFHVHFLRPIVAGTIRAVGRLVHAGRTRFVAEAIAYDSEEREIARGSGTFLRSGSSLRSVPGYSAP
jgi:uncharacterized protein (TIGR00369 family)